jgi:type I restriction enzyme S subunit
MRKYDSYKDSGIEWIGEIPKHWSVSRLRFNSKIKTGYTPPMDNSENYSDDGMIWVKPDNLEYFKPILDSKEKISPLGIKEQNIIAKDSVLLCCIGSIGKFGIAGLDLLTNQQICGITFNNSLLPSYGKYLVYVSEEELNKYANGNVVRILNATSLGNIEYPIPVIEEQTAIANYLDQKTTQIDDLIAKKERLIQLLEEERTAMINQLVTKGLDPTVPMKDSGVEWLGEIPEHWVRNRLDWVTDIVRGNTDFRKDELLNTGEYVALQYGKTYKVDIVDNSFNFFVNSEFYKESQVVSQGDTILISTSETIEDLGHTCFYNNENIGLIGGEQILIKPNRGVLFEKYLYQYTRQFSMELKRYAKGLKVFRFNTNDLKQLFIAIPSIEEQIQISDFIDIETSRIDDLTNKMRKEIILLKEFKTALISEVVTGKVDVRNEKLN